MVPYTALNGLLTNGANVAGLGLGMTTFDDRERAFEKKFSMDQEFKFKAHARCNRLLAEWAATKLGFSGPAVGEYIKAVVKADLAGTGDGAYHKLKRDFQDKGISVTDSEVRKAMAEFLVIADRQVVDAGKSI
jgi:hypothetical protein